MDQGTPNTDPGPPQTTSATSTSHRNRNFDRSTEQQQEAQYNYGSNSDISRLLRFIVSCLFLFLHAKKVMNN
jgi:hypothetical protein